MEIEIITEEAFKVNYLSRTLKPGKLTFGYDFSQSSSYGHDCIYSANEESSCIKVIEEMGFDITNSQNYSGQFIGDHSTITGHFLNNYSSRGMHFDKKTYLNIQNKNSSDNPGGSFVFSYEKAGPGTEIIFSNYSNSSSFSAGFEFGINDANKLFFSCDTDRGKFVRVFNNIPHKKNIYWLDFNTLAGVVTINWWDSYAEEFESEKFDLDFFDFQGSSLWILGSGDYSGENSLDYSAGGYALGGYMDKFFHFDENINVEDASVIAESIYSTFTYKPAESGQYVESIITGFETYVDEVVSGITGYEEVITGYTPLIYEEYSYVTGSNLYGNIVSGDIYYKLLNEIRPNGFISGSATGVYEQLISDSPSFEITGFNTGYATERVLLGGGEPLYFFSGVSGELYKTYAYNDLLGPGDYHKTKNESYELETGVIPIILSDGLDGYGPKSYTYLGARDNSTDFIETQKGVNLFSVNNFAGISNSSLCENPIVFFDEDITFKPNSLSLSINGVTKERGSIEEVGEYFTLDRGEFSLYEDIDLSESEFKQILIDDENLSLHVDSPVIDIVKEYDSESLIISNISQYSSAPFADIDPTNKNVFLNGQKIYEGIDYNNNGGAFEPIGGVLQITGVYHTTSDWHLDSDTNVSDNVTGYGNYDSHEPAPVLLSSYVSYLNGIRLDPKAFIFHDKDVDLISQGYSFIAGKQYYEIYNNYDINRMGFEQASAGGVAITGVDWSIMGTIDSDGTVLDEYGNPAPPGTLPLDYDPEEIDQYEDI